MKDAKKDYTFPSMSIIEVQMESGLLIISGEAGKSNIYNDQGEY